MLSLTKNDVYIHDWAHIRRILKCLVRFLLNLCLVIIFESLHYVKILPTATLENSCRFFLTHAKNLHLHTFSGVAKIIRAEDNIAEDKKNLYPTQKMWQNLPGLKI